MAAQKGVTVATTDFPLYLIRSVGDLHFLVAGGGGQAKTGVPNAFELYELKAVDGSCVAVKVKHHGTGSGAVMNGCIAKKSQSKEFIAALGIDSDCHTFTLRTKLVTPKSTKTDDRSGNSLRKRKGNLTDSKAHNSLAKNISFDVEVTGHVKTDRGEGGGFQKAASFTPDLSVLATAGSEGVLRVWKIPDLKKLYEVKAHEDEIDDIHISPPGNRIVTVSRDGKAIVWNTKDGSKHQELLWDFKRDTKYRFRACRFAPVIDKKDIHFLYTTNIPAVRSQKPIPCYITKWDTSKYVPKKIQSVGTEVLSAFAVSDDGVYVGTGTISGSVSVYIAFSLQRLYHLKQVHSIFVTGVDFMPNSDAARSVTGNHELTMFSVSADNQIKMHQVAERQNLHILWPIVGFLMCIYMVYWIIITLGL